MRKQINYKNVQDALQYLSSKLLQVSALEPFFWLLNVAPSSSDTHKYSASTLQFVTHQVHMNNTCPDELFLIQ